MNELTHLLLDWHHWAFEIVSGAAIGATLSPLLRWAIRKHDRKHHEPERAEPFATIPMVSEVILMQGRVTNMQVERLQDKIRMLEARLAGE